MAHSGSSKGGHDNNPREIERAQALAEREFEEGVDNDVRRAPDKAISDPESGGGLAGLCQHISVLSFLTTIFTRFTSLLLHVVISHSFHSANPYSDLPSIVFIEFRKLQNYPFTELLKVRPPFAQTRRLQPLA